MTSTSLARELDVSDRTIKRDIEAMRSDYGAPIAWEASSQTYAYEHEFEFLPLVRLTADEALALELAGATFGAWRGTPLGAALLGALEKISHVVAGAVSVPAVDVAALVYVSDDEDVEFDERRWFAIVLEAIKRQRVLRLRYLKARSAEPETRVVHPLHLAHLDHRWVLVAFDPCRQGLRKFVVGRIRDAQVTSRHFSPPDGFDPKTYLLGSMGRFTGESEIEVRIAFDAIVAPYVRERPWHRSQVIVEKEGGAIEATFWLNNLIDIQRRILACGSHAEVLKPQELRSAILAEAQAMAANCEKSFESRQPGQPVSQPTV